MIRNHTFGLNAQQQPVVHILLDASDDSSDYEREIELYMQQLGCNDYSWVAEEKHHEHGAMTITYTI